MSHTATPISPARFAEALTGLELPSLYTKAAEIRNSIAHLRHSNDQLRPFVDEGDADCAEASRENVEVMGRMQERLDLLKTEVEKRGFTWVDPDKQREEGEKSAVNGVNGTEEDDVEMHDAVQGQDHATGVVTAPARISQGGTLDDDELARRLATQMDEDDQAGMHL